MRVLVVRHEKAIVDLIRVLLEIEGHQVQTELSSSGAIQKARTFVPRLLMIDPVMPGIMGTDAAKQIASETKCDILFMTAGADDSGLRECISDELTGFDFDILPLPFEKGTLLSKVADMAKRPRTKVPPDTGVSFTPSSHREVHEVRTRWSMRLAFDRWRRKLSQPDALLKHWGDVLQERKRQKQSRLKYWRSKQILYGEKWVITSRRLNFLNRRVYGLACRFAPHDLYEPGLLECAVRIAEGYLKQKKMQRQQEKKSGPIWVDTSDPNKILRRVIDRVYEHSPGAHAWDGDWNEPEYEQTLLLLQDLSRTIWREQVTR